MANEIGGQHVLQLGEEDFNKDLSVEAIRHSYHSLHFEFNKVESRAVKNELKKLKSHGIRRNFQYNSLKKMVLSLSPSLASLLNTRTGLFKTGLR